MINATATHGEKEMTIEYIEMKTLLLKILLTDKICTALSDAAWTKFDEEISLENYAQANRYEVIAKSLWAIRCIVHGNKTNHATDQESLKEALDLMQF